MSLRIHETGGADERGPDNQDRVKYAMRSIQELATEVVRQGTSGTIGVEIPFKDGKLGRVKQIRIVYQTR